MEINGREDVITALNYAPDYKAQLTLDLNAGERIYAVKVAVNEDSVVSMGFLIAKDT